MVFFGFPSLLTSRTVPIFDISYVMDDSLLLTDSCMYYAYMGRVQMHENWSISFLIWKLVLCDGSNKSWSNTKNAHVWQLVYKLKMEFRPCTIYYTLRSSEMLSIVSKNREKLYENVMDSFSIQWFVWIKINLIK